MPLRLSFLQVLDDLSFYSITNISFTNLKTEHVRMDWVKKIRAWVYQIPFLKSIHFNFISKISRNMLENVTCIS